MMSFRQQWSPGSFILGTLTAALTPDASACVSTEPAERSTCHRHLHLVPGTCRPGALTHYATLDGEVVQVACMVQHQARHSSKMNMSHRPTPRPKGSPVSSFCTCRCHGSLRSGQTDHYVCHAHWRCTEHNVKNRNDVALSRKKNGLFSKQWLFPSHLNCSKECKIIDK